MVLETLYYKFYKTQKPAGDHHAEKHH
jgi:hypothetical protein